MNNYPTSALDYLKSQGVDTASLVVMREADNIMLGHYVAACGRHVVIYNFSAEIFYGAGAEDRAAAHYDSQAQYDADCWAMLGIVTE